MATLDHVTIPRVGCGTLVSGQAMGLRAKDCVSLVADVRLDASTLLMDGLPRGVRPARSWHAGEWILVSRRDEVVHIRRSDSPALHRSLGATGNGRDQFGDSLAAATTAWLGDASDAPSAGPTVPGKTGASGPY